MDRLLEPLGITGEEELAYRVLLQHAGGTLSEVAAALEGSRQRVRRILGALEAKGLASRSPDRPTRYIPVPPRIAVDALIAQREGELKQARLASEKLAELSKAAARTTSSVEEPFEIITGRAVNAQRFQQLQAIAEREVLTLTRPPYAATSLVNPEQLKALSRGVIYRTIVDRTGLLDTAMLELLPQYMAAGEHVRVFPSLPIKLAIFDRRIALIAGFVPDEEITSGLLVRAPTILHALVMLFEALWERSTAIRFESGTPHIEESRSSLPPELVHLIPLLASGVQDKSIARQLGLSPRTFERRMRALMASLDATTRFQAGWVAATRGNPGD